MQCNFLALCLHPPRLQGSFTIPLTHAVSCPLHLSDYTISQPPSPPDKPWDTSTPPSRIGEFGSGEMGEVNQKENRMLGGTQEDLCAMGIIVDFV